MLGETEENWHDVRRADARARAGQRHHLPDGAAVQHDDQQRPAEGHRPVRREPVADWATKRRWVDEAFEALERAGYHVGSAYTAVKDPAQGALRLPRSAVAGRRPGRPRRRVVRPRQRRPHAEPRHVGDLQRRRSSAGDAAAAPRLPSDRRRAADPRVRAAAQEAARSRPAYFAEQVRRRHARSLRDAARVARSARATWPRSTAIASR